MDKLNLHNFLTRKFSNFEVAPQADSFDAVMRKLQAAQKKKRRRVLVILFSGLGLFTILFLNYKPLNISSDRVAEKSNTAFTSVIPKLNKDEHENTNSKQLSSELNVNSSAKNSDLQGSKKSAPKNVVTTVPDITPPSKQISIPSLVWEANVPTSEKKADKPGEKTVSTYPQLLPASGLSSSETDKVTDDTDPSKENNSLINPLTKFSEQNTSSLLTEPVIVLSPVKISNPFNPNSELQTDNEAGIKLEKDLIRLKAAKFANEFYLGISYQPTLFSYNYELSGNYTQLPNNYPSGFSDSYLKNINDSKKLNFTGIPGIKAGIVLRKKFELGTTLGYYKLSSKETVHVPETDTNTLINNGFTISPLTVPPSKSHQSGSGSNTEPNSLDGKTFKNDFSYVFATLDANIVFAARYFKFKPGVSFGFNKITKASYIYVDTSGYNYVINETSHLNTSILTFAVKAGFSRTVAKHLELQLSPAYVLSTSSVFAKNYFIKQKLSGFGIEAALIYKIPFRARK